MKTYSWNTFAAIALMAVTPAGSLPAQDDAKPDAAKVEEPNTEPVEPAKPTKPTRAELRDKQLDVSLEARDIERILGKLKKASELSKTRITEAAKVAESASTSLDKGDSKAARAEAQQTAEMFREIAKQLEALLKEETPQRIAEARQLAAQLAKAEREFAEKFQGAMNPVQTTSGQGKVDPRSQVKPMTDPDMKRKGGQGQQTSGGKNQEPRTKNQKGDEAAKDQENGKDGGDKKPMPDGQGGDKPDGKKPGAGDKSDDSKDKGKDGDKKKPDGVSGEEPGDKPNGGGAGKDKDDPKDGDDQKPGGAGSAKNKPENKPGENQDGSGGDKSSEKNRDGSGDGSDKDRRDDKDGNGAGLTAEQLRELVADRADKLAESGKTLQDVLNEIAKSTDPNEKDAVAKIQAVLKEIDINKVVGEMGQVSGMIRSKKDDDAKLSSLDVADRLEIMAQRLDAAYRGIVAPQAEELRKLEQALADLRDQLEKLETPSQVAAWHRDARELLDQLDKLGVNLKAREEFEKEMTKAGFGVDVDRTKRGALNWSLTDGRYDAPLGYGLAIVHLQEDVQARIQTLILGDLGNVSDEATPPKYQELVEKYYEVLSRQGGKSGKPETSSTRGKQTAPVRKP